MNELTPEQREGILKGYMAYWRKAPEGFEKENMMAILNAWEADRHALVVAGDIAMELSRKLTEAEAHIEALEKDNQTMARFIREHMAWGRYYDPGLKKIVEAALRGEEEKP